MFFSRVLFNLHVFGDFSAIFLLMVFSLIAPYSKSKHWIWFLLLWICKVCFMAQNVIYLDECSMWVWEEMYSAVVGWNSLYIPIISCRLMMFLNSTVFLLIFCLLDSFLKGVDVPNCDSEFNYFSMKILWFLTHTFGCSDIKPISSRTFISS